MYAKVELTDDIVNFINETKNHIETFDEIQKLVFSDEMKKKNYTVIDVLNYSFMFQRIKSSAFSKVLLNKKLNYPEGVVFERLLLNYRNSLYAFDDYLSLFKTSNCDA